MNNYVEYEVQVDGLILKDDIEISSFPGCKDRIKLITNENGNLIINIPISEDTHDKMDAVATAESILEDLLDIIALERCSYIGKPSVQEIVLKDRHHTRDDIFLRCLVTTPAYEVVSLQRSLEKPKTTNRVYSRLYRNVLQIPNPVARFVFLYSILGDLKGPGQTAVDSYILAMEPSVKMISSTRLNKKGQPYRDETEYTYLRNKVGHVDDTSIVPDVTAKIASLEPALSRLVRDAIVVP